MQTAMETVRERIATRESHLPLPKGSLKLLLALVSSDGAEPESVRRKLNFADSEFRSLLGVLQRQYLVDLVSSLDGDVVHESLRLTEDGESALARMMERTFELPE